MTIIASRQFQGAHATLHGQTLVLSVWGSAVAASAEPATLADLTSAGTESTATGYARQTFAAVWDDLDLKLRIDPSDQWPAVDLDGDPDVRVLVVSTDGATDADRDVITMEELPSAVAGYDGWIYQPANGLVGYYNVADLADRATALEARTVAGVASVTGDYPTAALRTALGVTDPGTPATWGSGAAGSAYVDRGRVWLDGLVGTSSGSVAVGTLPAGKRPAATVYLPISIVNDVAGTPASLPAMLSITSAGVVEIESTTTLTGDVLIPLAGLSFEVAS